MIFVFVRISILKRNKNVNYTNIVFLIKKKTNVLVIHFAHHCVRSRINASQDITNFRRAELRKKNHDVTVVT